ncbi:TetR/AcrR family transcriptional regulator [Aquisphaera insulae]|uniref:TetR/AcrR family transcriptional regulator n=1 Tax=Aquisphaera insulae TaxID=2712864 RepID=UPI0013EB33C7|nr:TetR/AcrR family transcriptional regulator [Aquisphaera insulae]
MPNTETREAVLDVSQNLLQTRGLNAFSFRDVAERVGIKAASIHYHFPSKTELCLALIARQRAQVKASLDQIDGDERDAYRKLARYVSVFRATLEVGNRMCLCGMLAADVTILAPSVVEDLRRSFEDHEAWLRRVLDEGKKSRSLRFDASPRDEARLILSSLEGAMLIARTFEDMRRFETSARHILAKLKASG